MTRKDNLLVHSEFANISIVMVFRIDNVPGQDGKPAYVRSMGEQIQNIEQLTVDEIEKERKKLAEVHHVRIEDVHPVKANEAVLLQAPISGLVC